VQRLGNAFDLGRVGAMGHSFGGTTAIDFCRREARVLGCADLDGRLAWDWPAYLEGLPRPLLYLRSDDLFSVKTRTDSAEVSARIDAERAAFDRSHAPTFEVIARHALHMDFSDFNFVGQPRDIALPFDPALMIRSFASFTMAFFEQSFRRDGALEQLLSSRIADTSLVVHVHQGRRP
jgi:dienelactone hydrolase